MTDAPDQAELMLKLGRLEGAVRKGVKIFSGVGQALAEIKQTGLYKLRFSTWDEYCRAVLGDLFDVKQVNYIVKAFLTTTPGSAVLVPIAQARALRILPTYLAKVAYKTAESKARDAGQSEPSQAGVERAVKQVTAAVEPIDLIRAAADDFKQQRRMLDGVLQWVDDYSESPWGVELEEVRPTIRDLLTKVKGMLKLRMPYCECIYCNQKSRGCKACRGRKPRWNSWGMFRNASKEQRGRVSDHA